MVKTIRYFVLVHMHTEPKTCTETISANKCTVTPLAAVRNCLRSKDPDTYTAVHAAGVRQHQAMNRLAGDDQNNDVVKGLLYINSSV